MRHSFAATLTLFAVAPLLAQDKHTLRLKFVPGRVVHTMQKQDMSGDMGGGKQMNQAISMWTEAKIADVKDGVAVIEQTYRRMKATSNTPKVDYDSDVEGSKPGMLGPATKLVGEKITMKLDESSNLKDVAVPEDLADGLERAGMNLKENFEHTVTAFPKDPIAIGETWTTSRQITMGQMGTMKTTVTNKLIDVKDDVVTIEQKVVMDEAGSKLTPGMKVELTKAEGLAKIDLRTGLPIDMTSDMQMKMAGVMTMSIRSVTKEVEPPAAKPAPKPEAPAPATGTGK